jgi:FAD/FMN-containing dehydrogenase
MFEEGLLLDAVVAQNEAQRTEMWARREAAAEIAMSRKPFISNDIAVPLDKVAAFLKTMERRLPDCDPAAQENIVAHLGDGNVHYTVWPSNDDAGLRDQIMELVEDVALSFGGSFSAEHGIGLSKLPSMRRRKDPQAISTMKAIKAALDPKGILNPGKLLP